MGTKYLQTQIVIAEKISCPECDGIIYVSVPDTPEPEFCKSVLAEAFKIDAALHSKQTSVLPIDLPAKRLIYSPTGPVDLEYDSVKVYAEAAARGVKRALKAGSTTPLLVLNSDSHFENVELVTLLGALEALYVPLEVREIGPTKQYKATKLFVWSPEASTEKLKSVVRLARALESGRFVARDIGCADPERMAPVRVQEYVNELFSGSNDIIIRAINENKILEKEYPLFAAVNRAASVVPRHQGLVMFLEYKPADERKVEETIMLVGKGVTYDTGGANIKIHGSMKGMSRDKCGAAAVVGFLQTVSLLRPQNIKVIAAIAVVRNSVGANAYVPDEIITSRSGARVRINNTDAEGRIAMADVLYHMKEMAQKCVNPRIFTIATLTGAALSAAGNGYTVAVDNSVARAANNAYKLQSCGESMGEMMEVAVLRRDDWEHHKSKSEGDNVLQSATIRERGYQGPCAFLMLASGLEEHGRAADKPLHYCHLDIAGSAGEMPDNGTGAPILALSKRFLQKEFEGCVTKPVENFCASKKVNNEAATPTEILSNGKHHGSPDATDAELREIQRQKSNNYYSNFY